ncbi:hypothetical protein Tco_0390308 [Tanacetum coccineum]
MEGPSLEQSRLDASVRLIIQCFESSKQLSEKMNGVFFSGDGSMVGIFFEKSDEPPVKTSMTEKTPNSFDGGDEHVVPKRERQLWGKNSKDRDFRP